MSIVDDLVENLVERNVVGLNGAFSIVLIDAASRSKDKSSRPFGIKRRTRTSSTSTFPSTRK